MSEDDQSVEMSSKVSPDNNDAPTLDWHHIMYKVNDGAKTILNNCSGQIMSGQFAAIMGPSGSGKTTLLDVLASRVDGSRKGRELTGIINVKAGVTARYVQQEDSLVGILTVYETLVVAARLAAVDVSKVDELLTDLGLAVCRDTKVGTIFFKGISGGQKRRLSIGVELVSSPSLLLLDEPTSGLDSASALQVVQLLKNLGNSKGVAVACTIHQPSHEAWQIFDTVSFMSSGKLAYFGPPGELLHYFLDQQGYPVPPHCNVADFMLGLINKDFASVGVKTADLDLMVKGYYDMAVAKKLIAPTPQGKKPEKIVIAKNKNTDKRAGFFTRFTVLAGRDVKEMLRDPGILGVRLAMFIMLSILLALMFWGLGADKTDADIVARSSLMFYVAAFMVFMSVAVLPFFVMQRSIFVKERCNKAYDVPEYVLAKFVVSIPGIFLLSIIATTIIVLGAGLNGFGIYLADLFISLLEAEAFMCLMAALVPHYIIGIALASGVFGFSMLCEGFFKVKSEIPDYLIWGYYISPHTYTFRTFMYNEFHPIKSFDSIMYKDGDAVLKFYDIQNVNMTNDLLVLVGFTIVVQCIFAWVLYKYHTGLR
jgi:ABC-type multidrug transport system ATPase subunit